MVCRLEASYASAVAPAFISARLRPCAWTTSGSAAASPAARAATAAAAPAPDREMNFLRFILSENIRRHDGHSRQSVQARPEGRPPANRILGGAGQPRLHGDRRRRGLRL